MVDYIEKLIDSTVDEIRALRKEIGALKTCVALDAQKQESLEQHIADLNTKLEVLQGWVHEHSPQLDRLVEDARDLRKRKGDLAWRVLGFILTGALAALAGYLVKQ